jgi:cytochrome c biogenesis protein CcmG/thiol:disulfide interchange protein DsbE
MSQTKQRSRAPATRALSLGLLLMLAALSASSDDRLDITAYRDKVVYIDFWASWCAPCRKSFPWMNSIQRQYANRGLVVLGINVDQERELAESFLREFNPQFRILFDTGCNLAAAFELKGMPTTLLVDRHGATRYRHVGFTNDSPAELTRELDTLLAEK